MAFQDVSLLPSLHRYPHVDFDVYEDRIHIHSQQLSNKLPGGKDYYLVSYTKNEKGESEDGRDFPLTQKIRALLDEIKSLQDELGIRSEFIFCHEDGE